MTDESPIITEALANSTGVIILCGGESSRMGQTKWSMKLDGISMLDRVLTATAAFPAKVVSVSAKDRERPSVEAALCIPDARVGRGPVEGVRTCVEYLSSQAGLEYVFVTSCDVPLLVAEVVERIVGEIAASHDDAVVARSGSRIHPTVAAYRLRPLDRLLRQQGDSVRRLHEVVSRLRSRFVEVGASSVMNVNTKDDLRKAELHLMGCDRPC